MRIHKAIIENYKSIYRPLELKLGGGVTLFVGMNNSGKSAILESIANQFQPNPHRSKATMPYEWSVPNIKSVVVLRIQEDFNVAYFRNVEMLFHLYRNGLTTDIDDYLFNIFDNQLPINIELEKYLLNGNVQDETIITEIGGESIYNKSESLQGHYSFIRRINGILEPPQSGYAGKISELRHIVKEIVNKTTYFCHAKRSVSGVSVVGIQVDLKPDFSNLASVLLQLQANPVRFEHYATLVMSVLPFIQRISLKPVEDNGQPKVRILIWTDGALPDREDLATPLDDAGSGVGQVLGILYLLVTSSDPRVIVIDEISNFLYPAAARKLLEVFAQYPQHQYLVSTHSADLLGHRAVERIYHVQLHDGQTQVDLLDKNDVDAMRLLMLEIGASISELYGAERILWVEGPTEERGFRDILKAFYNMSLVDCVLVGVHHTGDFEQKKGGQKRLIFNVYRKLSEAHSLLPKSIGFVFDHEGRTEKEIHDLERESGGTAHVLERRLYENYLLDPEAIVALLEHEHQKSLEDGSDWDTSVTFDQVEAWLNTHHGETKYKAAKWTSPSFLSNTDWLRDVHGADLLHDLFNELSDSRLSYKANKVTFSVWLTGWLLEHKRENLSDLAKFLKGVVDQKQD